MVRINRRKRKPKDLSGATGPSPGHRSASHYRAFKATSAQALNIEAHLTPINLELDKKMIHTAARLFFGPLSY